METAPPPIRCASVDACIYVVVVADVKTRVDRVVHRLAFENVLQDVLRFVAYFERRLSYKPVSEPALVCSNCIGHDNGQQVADSVAAQLIGNALPCVQQNLLLVVGVAFRCQQEREMGFRRVLRSKFPHLRIVERVFSDEIPETTYEQLSSFF